MKIKKLCAVALLLLLSFYAKAQNWQAYKGVWLKGYDNATQAPIPPTGYSALTYFADSLGTYVYDWDSLAWLRIPGAGGGGGGGGANASNGLSIDGGSGDVILGGSALNQTTTIDGAGQELYFGPETNRLSRFETHSQNAFVSTVVQGVEVGQIEMLLGQLTLFQDNSSSSTTWRSQPSNIYSEFRLDANNVTSQNISGSGIESIYRSSGVSTTLNLMDEQVRLASSAGSGLEFDVASTSEAVIESTASGDNLRFTTNNGNLIFDDPVFLPQSPTVLDTAVWFLARRNSDGAIVRRQAAGGGSVTADNGLNIDPAGNVRIGTHSLPGFVESDGAVFSTDSLADAFSTFTFDADSVQISHYYFDGELDFASYLRLIGITASLHANANALTVQPSTVNTVLITRAGNNQFAFSDNEMVMGSAGIPGTSRTIRAAGAGATILNLASSGSAEIGLYGGFHRFISNAGREITADPDEPIVANVKSVTDRTFVLSAGTGTASTNNGDSISLLGGSAYNLSGDGNGGNVLIQSGQSNGSGTDGNITIDALSGFLIISNIPTTDPCGSAPTGTVWSDGGTLKVCP